MSEDKVKEILEKKLIKLKGLTKRRKKYFIK